MLTPIERFFSSGLRLTHLRLLVALADLKQVTKVAAAFHVTQPAVSKQIGEIEQALGTAITERVGKAVLLTDVGAVLARRGQEILRQVGLAQRDVASLVTGTAGHVNLGSVTAVPPTFISQSMVSFLTRAPAASVRFIEAPLDKLLEMLRTGEADLVLARARAKDDPDLMSESLYSEPFVFVAGPSHALSKERWVTLKDLKDFTWLVPQQGSPSYIALAQLMEEEGLDIKDAAVESSSIALNIELMARAPFVAILPLSYATEYVARGRISLMNTPSLTRLGEVVLYRRADLDSPAPLLLAECMREEAAEAASDNAPPDGISKR
ncbi:MULTISPECIES: LysR family transcriptional regulator [Paraburkholderia]|jgi:DNA-binding transcriptional LysR family regulator|uniref:LysR family transcriptional regulator n=1 Tax=Paraburkholderia hospita TaxID=169430 RepID=A0AAN1J943_9BURK|nr:LysR family transcriptional regulator [Paraburkholderia hospita]AUT68672.1 LysR family transcriptional regulator [Paraburkholderia hospita]SEI25193.1 transcriptional regulator, LysR family [Paraburkholderia hospita]